MFTLAVLTSLKHGNSTSFNFTCWAAFFYFMLTTRCWAIFWILSHPSTIMVSVETTIPNCHEPWMVTGLWTNSTVWHSEHIGKTSLSTSAGWTLGEDSSKRNDWAKPDMARQYWQHSSATKIVRWRRECTNYGWTDHTEVHKHHTYIHIICHRIHYSEISMIRFAMICFVGWCPGSAGSQTCSIPFHKAARSWNNRFPAQRAPLSTWC